MQILHSLSPNYNQARILNAWVNGPYNFLKLWRVSSEKMSHLFELHVLQWYVSVMVSLSNGCWLFVKQPVRSTTMKYYTMFCDFELVSVAWPRYICHLSGFSHISSSPYRAACWRKVLHYPLCFKVTQANPQKMNRVMLPRNHLSRALSMLWKLYFTTICCKTGHTV